MPKQRNSKANEKVSNEKEKRKSKLKRENSEKSNPQIWNSDRDAARFVFLFVCLSSLGLLLSPVNPSGVTVSLVTPQQSASDLDPLHPLFGLFHRAVSFCDSTKGKEE